MTARFLPNIFLFTLDTLRRDSTTVYDPSLRTTPFLAELAHECVVFDDAISSSCWTLPSHASLFTGRYPSFHGATKRCWYLSEEIQTLPQVLNEAGYQTAGFTGGPYLNWVFGIDRGFEYYENCLGRRPSSLGQRLRSLIPTFPRKRMPVHEEIARRAKRRVRKVTAEHLNTRFRRWMDRRHDPQRPLFAFINYFDPHAPWLRRNNEFTPLFSERLKQYRNPLTRILRDDIPLDPAIRKYIVQLYRNEVLYMDSHLAEMIEFLKTRKLYEDSIVVILSDHGEMFGEHNLMDHIMLYEPVIRIPMLFRLPGALLGGKRIPHSVQNIDVFSTLLSTLGIPVAQEIQGEDLTGLMQHDIPLRRPYAISEFYPDESIAQHNSRFKGDFIACIDTPWKYIHNSSRSDELYHRHRDPSEQQNLIDSTVPPSDLQEKLLVELKSRVNSEVVTKEVEVDEVVRRRLQDLGYL